jgi:hypothetical protein
MPGQAGMALVLDRLLFNKFGVLDIVHRQASCPRRQGVV